MFHSEHYQFLGIATGVEVRPGPRLNLSICIRNGVVRTDFPALVKVFDLLQVWPDVLKRNAVIPQRVKAP